MNGWRTQELYLEECLVKGLRTRAESGEPARNSEVPATVSPILHPKGRGEEAGLEAWKGTPDPQGGTDLVRA